MTLLEPADTDSADTASTEQAAAHEHAWLTRSSHRTSAGLVRYVRCASCGGNRIDLQHHGDLPPAAISRVVAASP